MARSHILGVAAALLLSACAGNGDVPQPDPGSDTQLSVVTVVEPISDIVRQIAGDRATVRSLVPEGADAHSYSPRPRDAMRLADADLYVGVGIHLNDAALQLAQANITDPDRILLIGETLSPDAFVNDHDDGTGTLGPNPHMWTSVANVLAALPAIRDSLSAIDPDGTATFQANSDALAQSLHALDVEIRTAVASIDPANRVLVTFHDAWTYFARDYDLTYAVAVQGRDYSDPSAQAVRNLIAQIAALEVIAVFGSAVFPSDVLAVIAEETGATYVTGLSDDLFPDALGDDATYQDLMRYNAAIIVKGLQGDASLLN